MIRVVSFKKVNISIILFSLLLSGCFLDFKKKDLSKYNFNEGAFFDGQSMIQISPKPHTLQPYTFEAKIKADTSQSTFPAIFSSRTEDGFFEPTLFLLWGTNGVPAISLGRRGNVCYSRKGEQVDSSFIIYENTSPNLMDNQWHHIVMTRDSVDWQLYVDATLACSAPIITQLDLRLAISIGGDKASRYNTYFHGYIKDVKIWTSHTSDINELTNRIVTGNEPDLLGYWPLNPKSENPLEDLSLNKSHGVWAQ